MPGSLFTSQQNFLVITLVYKNPSNKFELTSEKWSLTITMILIYYEKAIFPEYEEFLTDWDDTVQVRLLMQKKQKGNYKMII